MKGAASFFRTIFNNKQAFAGMIILILFFLMATLGPVFIELKTETDFMNRYQPPSFRHPMGTDHVGRDTFAQIAHGSRDVLLIGVITAFFAITMGFIIGALAGFAGGKTDTILMFIASMFITIPAFPIQLSLTAMISVRSPFVMAGIIAAFGWAGLSRAIRAQILSQKRRDYILICRIMGLGNRHIIFKEMLPNLAPYLSITFVHSMQSAIMASVALMMMGFAPFSSTHWGTMLNLAITQTAGAIEPRTMFFLFSPIVCFILLQTGCIFFASGLDEALNPRLRS
ncbi:MAG: ABC transporter permease [Oscillospiraceae bacterium]|nr:ABC transporter permease [Oscillospiraceae bacterium]